MSQSLNYGLVQSRENTHGFYILLCDMIFVGFLACVIRMYVSRNGGKGISWVLDFEQIEETIYFALVYVDIFFFVLFLCDQLFDNKESSKSFWVYMLSIAN